jgi:hypothetical protein
VPAMPVVLYPTLLWLGLLTLVIPIIIHLLSQNRARLIKFSLVGFIQSATVAQMTQLRLTERILLALRLALLLLGALLLAHLVWPPQADAPKTHVLVTQDWLAHASAQQKKVLAGSLNEAKFTYLDPANPFVRRTLTAQQLLNSQGWPAQKDTGTNLWLGLFNYSRNLSENDGLSVYTTDRLQQFSGQRLPITPPLDWHILQVPQGTRGPLTMNLLVIYTLQQQNSVTYLRGAMNALEQQSGITVKVTYAQQDAVPVDSQPLDDADWVAYLSDQPPDDLLMAYVQQGGKLLITAAQADQSGHWSARRPGSDTSITISQLGDPALPQPIFAGLPQDRLWQTLDGQDVLKQYYFGQGQILAWHSRFTPKWNNLVTQLDFPMIVNGLLLGELAEQANLANGRLSPEQIRHSEPPKHAVSPAYLTKTQVTTEPGSWTRLLLVLLVGVFCAERIMAQRFGTSKKQQVDGT